MESIRETLQAFNPHVEVEAVPENLSEANAERLVGQADIVFGDGATHLVQVQVLFAFHHHRGTAGEVQAPIELLGGKRPRGNRQQGQGEDKGQLALPHKVDHFHQTPPPIDSFSTRRPP